MILTYSRSILLAVRSVKAETTGANKPVLSSRSHRCGRTGAKTVSKQIQYVGRRASTIPHANDDTCHHRKPQFLVQPTEIDCTSDYSINTLNHSANIAATCRVTPTFLTEGSQGTRSKHKSLPPKFDYHQTSKVFQVT